MADWNHVSNVKLSKLSCTYMSVIIGNLCYINYTGETDQAGLCTALDPISFRWESFALQLGLPYNTIQKIKAKSIPYDPTNCLNEVLSEWLDDNYEETQHGHQSWRKVCEATANKAGGNNKGLAIKIAEQHLAEEEQLGY